MATVKDFSCIGGLQNHIQILKETVLFPLMYGEIYVKFNIKPPRGLLFYGPPGTGKTLMAGALALECSNAGRKVSFISRKGSDCLSKWIGESEKRLREIFVRVIGGIYMSKTTGGIYSSVESVEFTSFLSNMFKIYQVVNNNGKRYASDHRSSGNIRYTMAKQTKPCIIFFDEIDGLAPVRSSRQDFVHTSVVSTLLALMDGLDSNSEVIVIGATNRLEAIDPALRRPGRFDKELYFPLPCFKTRLEILTVHVSSWKQKPAKRFLSYLASKTIGFCGSDLQALCAEAVMCCVRRNYPQIYSSKSKQRINGRILRVNRDDFLRAEQKLTPASRRVTISPLKRLSTKIRPLLEETLGMLIARLQVLCPEGLLSSGKTYSLEKASSRSLNCPRLLLAGDDDSQTRHIAPGILHVLEHLPCHVLDITTLYEVTGRAAEEAIIQRVKEARHTLPSLLYVPDILAWWDLVEEPARVVFTSLMKGLDRTVAMLILTTANCPHANLPSEIKSLYDDCQGEVFELGPPGSAEREEFFKQLFLPTPSTTSIPENVSQKSSTDVLAMVPNRKVSSEINARAKLKGVGSSQSTSPSGIPLKRELSAAGEAGASKRPKISVSTGAVGPKLKSVFSNLTGNQTLELLRRTVASTNGYNVIHLESVYALLEMAMANNENDDDLFPTIVDCLKSYEDTKILREKIMNERIYSSSVECKSLALK